MAYSINLRLLTELTNLQRFQEGINITVTESTLQKAMLNAIDNAARVFSQYTNRPETLTFEAAGTSIEGNLEKLRAIIKYNQHQKPETIEVFKIQNNPPVIARTH